MSLTTDPSDPRLTHGIDTKEVEQNSVYLILSEEERAKGFVRPLRRSYVHTGAPGPVHPLRDLSSEEREKYAEFGYSMYEEYPKGESPITGRYWTKAMLDAVDNGCGVETKIAEAIAETYARNPQFYGSTYCVGCRKHLPVDHFQWDDGSRVGS